jgi:hypothetical protein
MVTFPMRMYGTKMENGSCLLYTPAGSLYEKTVVFFNAALHHPVLAEKEIWKNDRECV